MALKKKTQKKAEYGRAGGGGTEGASAGGGAQGHGTVSNVNGISENKRRRIGGRASVWASDVNEGRGEGREAPVNVWGMEDCRAQGNLGS